jgi:predicted TIM-barrel fold metal-dependent hydrolase
VATFSSQVDNLAEQRLALMDESGIDVQVLSVTTPAFHNLEPEEGVTLARRTNDLVAETVAKHPTRFQGLATLPTASPEEAALGQTFGKRTSPQELMIFRAAAWVQRRGERTS